MNRQPAENRPNPDPSTLTTDQLQREIAGVKEEIECKKEVIETRLIGNDKAIELLQRTTDKIPDLIIGAVNHLQELHEEKFSSIQKQFSERDTRSEQASKDSKVAVDAALQAAKEVVSEQNKSNSLAMAKSEAAFTKQIDQIVFLVQQQGKTVDDKFDDMKTRLTAMESHKRGSNDTVSYIVAGISVLIAIGSLVAMLVMNKV